MLDGFVGEIDSLENQTQRIQQTKGVTECESHALPLSKLNQLFSCWALLVYRYWFVNCDARL